MGRVVEYRNVTIEPDGSIHGERRWSDEHTWINFSADPKLLRISTALDVNWRAAYPRIWAIQDGYGMPGITPVQGYDWSGIRDSTDEAIEAMYEVAVEFVSDEQMAEILGVKGGT